MADDSAAKSIAEKQREIRLMKPLYRGSSPGIETVPMMPSKPEGAVAREIRAKREEGENMGDYRRRVARMALGGEDNTASMQKAEGKTFPAEQPREPVKAEEPYTPPKGTGADEPGKGTTPPDKVGKLEASIEKATKENKWEPQTSDAVSEAASSLANAMEGIFVDALEVYQTSEEHDGGVPDRVYFTDQDGYEWESVREEDGWAHHPVEEEIVETPPTMPMWEMEPLREMDALAEPFHAYWDKAELEED